MSWPNAGLVQWGSWSCLPCLAWGLRGSARAPQQLEGCSDGGCTLLEGPDPPRGPEPLRHVPLASRVGDCKHGMMKFREERNLLGLGLSTGFHDRYFILNHSWLRLYKEVRVSPASHPGLSPSPALPWPFPALPCPATL